MSVDRRIARQIDKSLLCRSVINRFMSKCTRPSQDACWEWKRPNGSGYGTFHSYGAHRFAYVAEYGEPDPSFVVAHKCDNKRCVNPTHLEAITHEQNVKDAWERIEFNLQRGEDNCNAILTTEIVQRIMHLCEVEGLGRVRIGRILGLNTYTVLGVTGGKNWGHVTGGRLRRGSRRHELLQASP